MSERSSRRTALKLFGGLAVYTAGIGIVYEGEHNIIEGSKRAEIAENANAVQQGARPLDHPQIHAVSWDVEIDDRGEEHTFELTYSLGTDTDFSQYPTASTAVAENSYVEAVGAAVFEELVGHLGQYGGTESGDLSTYQIAFDGTNGSLTYRMDYWELADEMIRRYDRLEELYQQTLDHEHLILNA